MKAGDLVIYTNGDRAEMDKHEYTETCHLCETTIGADSWEELRDLKAEYGWKDEYDTGLWISLCPDCWEL